jgi:hypothetical protein
MSWTLASSTTTTTLNVSPEWNDITFARAREEGRFQPLGRTYDIFVTGTRRGLEFEVTFLTIGDAEYAALDALLARAETLRLSEGSRGWWVRVLHPINITLVATGDQLTRPFRRVTVKFVEQAAP